MALEVVLLRHRHEILHFFSNRSVEISLFSPISYHPGAVRDFRITFFFFGGGEVNDSPGALGGHGPFGPPLDPPAGTDALMNSRMFILIPQKL